MRTQKRGTAEDTLFSKAAAEQAKKSGATPLAERMRPVSVDEYLGQTHVVGGGKPLARAIAQDRVPSMILWGPPGVGKTSLGHVIAATTKSVYVPFSAVLGSLPELREIVATAKERLSYRGERTLVFVDEIHRFNRAQQDAFLPHVEAGTITLVGATTENPSFAVNAALLSRCKVFHLEALGEDVLVRLLGRALMDAERGLGASGVTADDDALMAVAKAAGGDARRALGLLESAVAHVTNGGDASALQGSHLSLGNLTDVLEKAPLLYDKGGEEHYNITSAFIKSMRGSDPDAAIYYLLRMLEAGDDPLFLLRRMMIFASEDIGNADPRALYVATSADAAFRRMGMPEGMYPLAQCTIYLASAPKSNAVTKAWQRAKAMIDERGALPVPKKLRNAVSSHMKAEGYGADYKYAHDFPDGVPPGETYLPDVIANEIFYEPTERGEELRIGQRLAALRAKRKVADD